MFAPPALLGPAPFADLQAMIGKAEAALEAFTPDEGNSWAGKDLDLQIGPRRLAWSYSSAREKIRCCSAS